MSDGNKRHWRRLEKRSLNNVLGGVTNDRSAFNERVPSPPPSFVYFIQAGEGGPIKIGWAYNPSARMSELQIGNPVDLRIIGAVYGDGELESELHRKFRRLKLRGEWFRPGRSLMTYIAYKNKWVDVVDLVRVELGTGRHAVVDRVSRVIVCIFTDGGDAWDFVANFNRLPFMALPLESIWIPIDRTYHAK